MPVVNFEEKLPGRPSGHYLRANCWKGNQLFEKGYKVVWPYMHPVKWEEGPFHHHITTGVKVALLRYDVVLDEALTKQR